MGIRAFFKDRFGQITAMLGIAVITALSTLFVVQQYQEVRNQSAVIQTRVFRDGLAVDRDLALLASVLERTRAADVLSQDDLEEFGEALDFLYVRTESLKVGSAVDPNTAIRVAAVIFELLAIIEEADRLFAADLIGDLEATVNLRNKIDTASTSLLELVDVQFVLQNDAIETQIETLETLTFTSIFLLWVFAVITSASIFLFQRQLRTQAQRRKAEDKANFLAFYDSLTSLPNRIRFSDAASQLIDDQCEPIVFLFDLDDFKLVNDIHGHAAGDAVLARAAHCIRLWAEKLDGTPARLGGDEFAAAIPGPMSSMRIASVCEDLLREVTKPFEFEATQLQPKMSIGVASSSSIEADKVVDLAVLQKAADVALYHAKEQGKNTYAFYDADLAELAARRREIEIGIDEALRDDGFTLAYQPQVDMKTGQIKGFEALCRWTRDGQFISPGEFIPVAEATGQVVEIDLWGLRKSVQQVADWIRNGMCPVTISANLSPLHFRSDAIVGHVGEALRKSGLPPHLLTLEITESILIADMATVTATLEKLRRLGVRIALDDFGTGYSSLAYLRKLDVDYIKIDQSFVRDLEESDETQVILDALVDIAKGLKKMLVVEGVETESQAKIIRDLGCDYGQGYLWGKPLPVEDAQAMVPRVEDVMAEIQAS